MSDALQVHGVSKRFGGVTANEDISLTVPEGAIVGLIGPNGSGKTTLFNSIVGFHPIDAGSIRFAGEEISHLRAAQIARRGMLRTFQQTHIFARLTCLENMQVSVSHARAGLAEMFGAEPRDGSARARELLAFVGLDAKRNLLAGSMSFGQQKLLEFAMALMSRPRMLLLDEPTAGINPTLINGLMERLRQVNADWGITLLVIEHNMHVIMNLAQHIYCLAHGRLLTQGTPEEIRSNQSVHDAYLGAS